MTKRVFLAEAAAALIKLHHFNVNFDEGWGREMKGFSGADLKEGSEALRLCLNVSQL